MEAWIKFTIQVAPEDCTGCGICVDVCPAKNKSEPRRKAINMAPQAPLRDAGARELGLLPRHSRARSEQAQDGPIRHQQLQEPLFEFCSACAGCGETPYLKLRASCSATGWSSRTRPAARRSTAGTCRRRPGRRTAKAAGRRGPTRCSKTTPSSAWASGSRSTSRGSSRRSCSGSSRRRSATISSTAILAADQTDEAGHLRAAQARRRLKKKLRGRFHAEARSARGLADMLVQQERLDRGRRRLGLRHRLRRPRPRAASGEQRERAGPRYRGVFEHRRAEVEVDPARRGRQVRRRRKPAGKKDLGLIAMTLRPRLCRECGDGREGRAHAAAFLEAESYRRAVAHHRLQPLHRPRHQHGDREVRTRRPWSTRANGSSTGYHPTARPAGRESAAARFAAADSSLARAISCMENRFKMLTKTQPGARSRALQDRAGRSRRALRDVRISRVAEGRAPKPPDGASEASRP